MKQTFSISRARTDEMWNPNKSEGDLPSAFGSVFSVPLPAGGRQR